MILKYHPIAEILPTPVDIKKTLEHDLSIWYYWNYFKIKKWFKSGPGFDFKEDRIGPPSKHNLVFPNQAGGPTNHNNLVNRHFNPALKATELPITRFHDLRHTYASLLIEQGENIKYIQSQLGHSSPIVTLSVYAHLMKSFNQESARRLENTIWGGNIDKKNAGAKI